MKKYILTALLASLLVAPSLICAQTPTYGPISAANPIRLVVVKPMKGWILTAGTKLGIQWGINNIGTYGNKYYGTIDFIDATGKTYTISNVLNDTTLWGGVQTYQWTVGTVNGVKIPTGIYTVKISVEGIYGVADSVTIAPTTGPVVPSIKIISPMGGENYPANAQVPISWNMNYNSNSLLFGADFLRNGGSEYGFAIFDPYQASKGYSVLSATPSGAPSVTQNSNSVTAGVGQHQINLDPTKFTMAEGTKFFKLEVCDVANTNVVTSYNKGPSYNRNLLCSQSADWFSVGNQTFVPGVVTLSLPTAGNYKAGSKMTVAIYKPEYKAKYNLKLGSTVTGGNVYDLGTYTGSAVNPTTMTQKITVTIPASVVPGSYIVRAVQMTVQSGNCPNGVACAQGDSSAINILPAPAVASILNIFGAAFDKVKSALGF